MMHDFFSSEMCGRYIQLFMLCEKDEDSDLDLLDSGPVLMIIMVNDVVSLYGNVVFKVCNTAK